MTTRRAAREVGVGFTLCLTLGCGTAHEPRPTITPRAAEPQACTPDQDRAAILAMAGEYEVSFSFEETVPLAAGYQLKPPYRADAREEVLVIEQTPTRISLQHILLVPGDGEPAAAMKHWRQDWIFENADLLEFQGHARWWTRHLDPAEVRCSWTQAVYGVEDEPRYESWGHWAYAGGIPSWTSNPTWRPLPRPRVHHARRLRRRGRLQSPQRHAGRLGPRAGQHQARRCGLRPFGKELR